MGVVADPGPAVGAVHGLLHLVPFRPVGDALVQAHDDVGAQPLLVGDGQFGSKDMLAAVNVGAEPYVVVVHPPEGAHAESLESPAVGENGPGPPHELMQAAQLVYGLHPGPQVQVVSVAQDNLRPNFHNFIGRQRLDGGLGSHGHEYGRVHGTVGRGEPSGPGPAVRWWTWKVKGRVVKRSFLYGRAAAIGNQHGSGLSVVNHRESLQKVPADKEECGCRPALK